MSTRIPLVIELKNKGVSAYCYIHHGANTLPALMLGKEIIQIYKADGYETSPLDPEIIGYELFYKLRKTNASRYTCPSYAGLTEESYAYMCKKYPDYPFAAQSNRNAGFIYLDAVPAEHPATLSILRRANIPTDSFIIDFDKESVDFGLFTILTYDCYDQTVNTGKYWEKIDLETLPTIDLDFKNIPFDAFDKLHNRLAGNYDFIHNENDNRYIYSLIDRMQED